jgi:TetR/AcrR family transcriptional regulator, regulator of cefoperazone and chloramphenicol sensitivity
VIQESKLATKEKIYNAAVKLMGQRAIKDISVKEIAIEADVNIAAISYYFQSKENLFQIALSHYQLLMSELMKMLDDQSILPRDRMKNYCYVFCENLIIYPGIEKNMLRRAISEVNIVPSAQEFTKILYGKFRKNIQEATELEDEGVITFKFLRVFSSLMYTFMLKSYGPHVFGMEYKHTIRSFIDMLIDDL